MIVFGGAGYQESNLGYTKSGDTLQMRMSSSS